MSNAADCVFCAILAGNEPASLLYRDDRVAAFMDTKPINPGHALVIPVAHAASLADLDPEDGAEVFRVGQQLGAAMRRASDDRPGLRCEGVNLLLADGAEAGQQVFHVHLDVLPRFAGDGFGMHYGPEFGELPPRDELDALADAIRRGLD